MSADTYEWWADFFRLTEEDDAEKAEIVEALSQRDDLSGKWEALQTCPKQVVDDAINAEMKYVVDYDAHHAAKQAAFSKLREEYNLPQ